MTFVKVVEECGRWRLHTTAGNPIGPRLWGAEPPNGLPPLTDLFEDKQAAQDAAQLWNHYAAWCQERSGKTRKKQWTRTR